LRFNILALNVEVGTELVALQFADKHFSQNAGLRSGAAYNSVS
jgi:hypothetical protein